MLQLIIAASLALLLIGYAAGRRLGMMEGRRLGAREEIVRLRDDAYATGVCPLCGFVARRTPQTRADD